MRIQIGMTVLATVALGACSTPAPEVQLDPSQPGQVPEAVFALAAPNQDISTARVLPEDGCYWYFHSGPVETTLLPLLTDSGQKICPEPVARATPS